MESFKKVSRRKKILVIIAVVFVATVLVNSVLNITRGSNTNNLEDSSTNTKITKETAEDVCHEAAIIKTQGRDIDVVSLGSYNPHFNQLEAGSILSWNGKSSDGSIHFTCRLNGTNELPEIESLNMGSEQLQ